MFKLVVCAAMAAAVMADGHLGKVPEMTQDAAGIKVTLPDGADASITRYDNKQANMDDVQTAQEDLADQLGNLQGAVGSLSGNISEVTAGIAKAAEATASISDAKFEVNEAKDVAAAIANSQTNTYSQQQVAINNFIKSLDSDVEKIIDAAIGGLETDIANGKKAIAKTLEKLNAAETLGNKIAGETDALSEALAKHEVCAKTNQIYDASKKTCINAEIPTKAFIPKVSNVVFNNADGRDSGYINGRVMKFVKHTDDSYLRIFWYDNLRVHGHTAHGRWNVYICDANGNGCAECRNPGRLNAWKWSGHQHNWWMNDHVGHVLSGLCKATSNRALKKGTYQMKIYLHSNRYDMYTGHNQANNFMVDEVIKY